jgi:WD40 repeat protein
VRPGAESFARPAEPNQRRYEALRAYFVDGVSAEQVAQRFDYTRATVETLVRDYRAGSVLALAFSPDGQRLAHGNQDASIHYWDLRKHKELEMWGYDTKVRERAWSNDGRWLATGGGASVTVWDTSGRKGPQGSRPLFLDRHEQPITALAFQPAPGTLLASAGRDGLVALWSLPDDDLPVATDPPPPLRL